MKKLQRYIVMGTLKALVPAFVTLVAIMAVGFCLRLLHEGLDIVRLRPLLPSLVQYCVPMVLPSAFLTAVIMTFGRLSADNELLAVRAGGISIGRIIYPVLLLALVLSAVATYFQFEMVPRARGRVKALEHKALQQILLDRVALSARRQFSFRADSGMVHIKYGDFRNGQMVDLLALIVERQRPRTVIRAGTCRIRPDPAHPEARVLFEMQDCVVQWLGADQYGERGPMTAGSGSIAVTVAEDPRDVMAQERHLGTVQLLARLRELQRGASEHRSVANPDRVYDALRSRLQAKRREADDIQRTLESVRSDRDRYAVEKTAVQDQVLATSKARSVELEASIAELQQQRLQVQQELQVLGVDHDDFERLDELQKTSRAIEGKIQEARKELTELAARIQEAQALKVSYAEHSAKLTQEVRELERVLGQLVAENQDLARKSWCARNQQDLRKIKLRIHKRLTQAASVFVFALLGIPIGILVGGRSVMVAFGISFAIVLMLFYPMLVLGQIAAESGVLPVWPALWAGNGLTFVIGLVLMVRVVRR